MIRLTSVLVVTMVEARRGSMLLVDGCELLSLVSAVMVAVSVNLLVVRLFTLLVMTSRRGLVHLELLPFPWIRLMLE